MDFNSRDLIEIIVIIEFYFVFAHKFKAKKTRGAYLRQIYRR
jgi:hypothetical protein